MMFILLPATLGLMSSCGEEASVSDTCNQFIRGRIALDKGDSTILKQITADSLFRLLMLNQEYIELLDAPVIGPDLNIRARSVEIKDQCATCTMSSSAYYQINLCKEGEVWKIKGENGDYETREKILAVRKKIADQKIYLKQKPSVDSVLQVVNRFFSAAKAYFEKQETEGLASVCDEASVAMIQRLYVYAQKRTGLDKILAEMKEPNFLTVDVQFDGDALKAIFYNEETTILLTRIDGRFVVSGFDQYPSGEITAQILRGKYLTFLRALKLLRAERYRNPEIQ
ncbi:MAG: hypothetical protein AAFP02_08970 [Bacteroidota bacterium]